MLYTGEGGKTSPKGKGWAAQTHKTHETDNTQWENRTCILTSCEYIENKRKSKVHWAPDLYLLKVIQSSNAIVIRKI